MKRFDDADDRYLSLALAVLDKSLSLKFSSLLNSS